MLISYFVLLEYLVSSRKYLCLVIFVIFVTFNVIHGICDFFDISNHANLKIFSGGPSRSFL